MKVVRTTNGRHWMSLRPDQWTADDVSYSCAPTVMQIGDIMRQISNAQKKPWKIKKQGLPRKSSWNS